MAIYMINGFFYQVRTAVGVTYKAECEGGVRAVAGSNLYQTMFAGILNIGAIDVVKGELMDYYGRSILIGVELTDSKLSFAKQYRDSSGILNYEFHRDGDFWIGEYSGTKVRGLAKCILTKVSEHFFEPIY